MDFYREEKNRKGWMLTNDDSISMIFEKAKKKMVIGVYKGLTSNTLIYQMTEETR